MSEVELIFELFDSKTLSLILGIPLDEIRKHIHEPHIQFVVQRLIEDNLYDGRAVSASEYNPNCCGPPNHLFEIQEGDPSIIKYFKRKIIEVADFLDLYDKRVIESSTFIGVKFLRKHNIPYKDLYSFVFACYSVGASILRVRLHRWDLAFNFFKQLNKVNLNTFHKYRQKILDLARKLGFPIPEERLEIYEKEKR